MKDPLKPERLTLDFADEGIPEVVLLGRNCYSSARPPLAPHLHPQVFEIVVLESGVQTYFLGSARYDLQGGDVFITKPDELHGTGGEPENRGQMYWLEFRQAAPGESFLGLDAGETQALMRSFLHLSARHFRDGQRLIPTFERILLVHADHRNPLRTAEIRNLLLRLLLDTIAIAERRIDSHYSGGIRRAIQRIERELSETLTIPELAREAGMSESYFKTVFRRETGMPPIEYAIRKRIEHAKSLLEHTDQPVTRIAADGGFASSQHFATVFRRMTGVTPTAFRQDPARVRDSRTPAVGFGRAFHPSVGA